MSNVPSRAVGTDEPVMVAWVAFRATPEYANTLAWAGKANEGNLWACFLAGFTAAGGKGN